MKLGRGLEWESNSGPRALQRKWDQGSRQKMRVMERERERKGEMGDGGRQRGEGRGCREKNRDGKGRDSQEEGGASR